MACIFCKIASGEIPSDLLYQDDEIIAFRDIKPLAPIHILIVPKKHFPTLNDINQTDHLLLGKMTGIAKDLAMKEGISEKGYRVVINCGPDGGQVVQHLHMHLMGGRRLADRVDWR